MISIENLHERVLRFTYNDYNTPYVDILGKAHIPSVSNAWQLSAGIEVYNGLEWSIHQVLAMYVHTKK